MRLGKGGGHINTHLDTAAILLKLAQTEIDNGAFGNAEQKVEGAFRKVALVSKETEELSRAKNRGMW